MNKLNPLHTPEWLDRMVKYTGCYADPSRATGRSTAIGLRTLATAIENPHQWIEIVDHHHTRMAAEELRRRMQDMVGLLHLKHLTFRATAVCFGEPPDKR